MTRLLRTTLMLLISTSVFAGPPTAETLRVAVHLDALRDASRTDVEVSLKVWAEELVRYLEVPTEIRFYDAMSAIRSDLDAGKINFIIADGVDLLRQFNPDELADGFGGRSPGEDSLLLLVRKDAGILSARDLPGKRVLLLSHNEISDLWMETACQRHFQKTCAKARVYISKEARSHQQVLQLFFGKVDAALVRGYPYELAIELNPQIRTRITVLERIPIYPGALGLFTKRVSPAFREYVIGKVPAMHDHPRGRQLLEVMQTEKIGRFPKSALEPIEKLLQEHEMLSARFAVHGNAP